LLLEQHRDVRNLYLSWDAASWHLSKKLQAFVDGHKVDTGADPRPRPELKPLPSGARFLNVTESVFSGMARAIIHNSDYASREAAIPAPLSGGRRRLVRRWQAFQALRGYEVCFCS
jgi:hypothetical protein